MFTPIHDRRSSAGHAIVQGIRPLGRQSARDLAHDRNDLLHDITAGAAASTSQQTPPQSESPPWRKEKHWGRPKLKRDE